MKKLGFLSAAILIAVVIAFGMKGKNSGMLNVPAPEKKEITSEKPAAEIIQEETSGEVAIGGNFSLTDQDGKTRTSEDFRGKKMLVFFGFTNCPMVCPTEMATITKAFEMLGDKVKNVQPVFISVDAERDNPEIIKNFLKNFHPAFTGLTGSKEQLDSVQKEYKVYAAKIENKETPENYNMDHSSFIYLMDEDGKYKSHFQSGLSPEELAKQLEKSL